MEVIHANCAGLDVHQKTVVACVRSATKRKVRREVRTCGTTTGEWLALSDWLSAQGCTQVARESTGVYWKPVWHVLEGMVELLLANAMHIRNIPGRKSEVNAASWIADLLAYGLIRGSFVPPGPIQELGDLTRSRKQLVRAVGQHPQRIQKVREDANLTLTAVLTDVLGQSGRAIIEAVIAGEQEPTKLARLAGGNRLKASPAELAAALRGRVTEPHRFLLKLHVGQIDALEGAVREGEARLGEALAPCQEAVEHLSTLPGVSHTVARVIVAEVGIDMAQFPPAGHLLSWAGLCPGLHESAGKRLSTRLRKGAPWLKTPLVRAAWAAVRTRGSDLRAQFWRLKSRRGPKKAIVAVAASMLTATYYILQRHVPYQDLGGDYFERRDKTKMAKRLIHRLTDLGLHVEVRSAA
jgi:transposase